MYITQVSCEVSLWNGGKFISAPFGRLAKPHAGMNERNPKEANAFLLW